LSHRFGKLIAPLAWMQRAEVIVDSQEQLSRQGSKQAPEAPDTSHVGDDDLVGHAEDAVKAGDMVVAESLSN
jgi:hypothetical protein